MKIKIFIWLVISNIIFAQFNQPKIEATKSTHDFGTIVEGQVVSTNFEIINNGSGELKIDRVNASCGCTAAAPTKNVLKPGEKTLIKVDFNSTGRLGPQEKYVYVMSNDPVNKELRLSFKCVVVDKSVAKDVNTKLPKLKLNKSEHDFGDVEEGKLVDTKIGFKNVGNAELIISEVKTSCGCTAALLSSKKLQPGESGNIRIELDTNGREGKLTRTIIIYSNDPEGPNQVITLNANILKRK
ncbi:MAG: DUF1573 domain-containing protein [Melioribacteraceae bacterium]|nr:DUF1573 domain-containing protein [Melioribacteraceae bacterium]